MHASSEKPPGHTDDEHQEPPLPAASVNVYISTCVRSGDVLHSLLHSFIHKLLEIREQAGSLGELELKRTCEEGES
jgi:hypothetical protein